jgi:8-oxo-dGTP pyrophosphatase MutT (NUDIX family)
MKNAYCSYCGTAFGVDQGWPRECGSCRNITYVNPLPVAVGLIPVDGGLLLIRRTVEPRVGSLALPGGFMNVGETWQEACVREIEEETGLRIPAAEVRLFDALTALDGYVLVFGIVEPRTLDSLPAFAPNSETSEFLVIRGPAELGFPLHQQVFDRYASEQGWDG